MHVVPFKAHAHATGDPVEFFADHLINGSWLLSFRIVYKAHDPEQAGDKGVDAQPVLVQIHVLQRQGTAEGGVEIEQVRGFNPGPEEGRRRWAFSRQADVSDASECCHGYNFYG